MSRVSPGASSSTHCSAAQGSRPRAGRRRRARARRSARGSARRAVAAEELAAVGGVARDRLAHRAEGHAVRRTAGSKKLLREDRRRVPRRTPCGPGAACARACTPSDHSTYAVTVMRARRRRSALVTREQRQLHRRRPRAIAERELASRCRRARARTWTCPRRGGRCTARRGATGAGVALQSSPLSSSRRYSTSLDRVAHRVVVPGREPEEVAVLRPGEAAARARSRRTRRADWR